MKQRDIDWLVAIVREDVPGIEKEIKGLKKRLDDLRIEREKIEKEMIGKASKTSPIVIYETTGGVLCEARDREGSVTIIDKQVAANG